MRPPSFISSMWVGPDKGFTEYNRTLTVGRAVGGFGGSEWGPKPDFAVNIGFKSNKYLIGGVRW